MHSKFPATAIKEFADELMPALDLMVTKHERFGITLDETFQNAKLRFYNQCKFVVAEGIVVWNLQNVADEGARKKAISAEKLKLSAAQLALVNNPLMAIIEEMSSLQRKKPSVTLG